MYNGFCAPSQGVASLARQKWILFGVSVSIFCFVFLLVRPVSAEEPLPWQRDGNGGSVSRENPLPPDESYSDYDRRPRSSAPQRDGGARYDRRPDNRYDERSGYERYERRPDDRYDDRYDDGRYGNRPPPPRRAGPPPPYDNGYSDGEIMDAGHRFFGTVSSGLAKVIEYAFSQNGRPNGYILGEEAGGAFVAGLRYGEGILYTKDAGRHRVYWQGPSIGYDFGAEGSKTMILVYNLYGPDDIYGTFGGVSGSAYLVGGVGITFQTRDHVTLAPIRAGVGARLGANVGYLKYTRRPTWNPF